LHGPKPERVPDSLADLRTRSVGAEERRGEILEELRAVGGDAARMSSNFWRGRPAGLECVWSIIGGTALTNTALATRLVPCRPM